MKKLYPKNRLENASMGIKVVSELRMRIISQAIESDTTLSENKLANRFQVSRSPVREALQILNNEGLIRLERMGAVVVGISEKDIEEMYDVRLMMESFVFERLLQQDNSSLLQKLEKIMEMMKVAIKYKDIDEFSMQDVAFHEAIIKSINHQQIRRIWANLKPVMECFIILSMRYRLLENPEDFDRIIDNHELIIASIAKKDPALMDKAFHQNFNDVQNKTENLWSSEEMMRKVRESDE
ncbi:MAG TPA: GntR family transcriptional regulator [Virgibacillus sp.]|nr:GntR family transcriptional regulator [Virgibacillus sp.]